MEINEFITCFTDLFEDTDPKEITAETEFRDLDEWDSLVALAVLNMSEKKFGKKLTFEEMKKCTTVGDLYDVISSE